MPKLFNRAYMGTATIGTGTITLGSAETGYQTFASAGVSDGDVVRYTIEDGTSWEIGTGTYTATGTTLSRTVSESSNADAAISLSGSAIVFVTAAAENIQQPPSEGAFVDGDKTKLNGIETGATADQTAGEIKTAYESNTNTNAYTDSEKTKLTGIETGADVTDTANVTAAGALMDSEVANLTQVKAFNSADYVGQTSTTGSATLPVGTTAQRDGTPSTGYLRYNSTDGSPEVYDGAGWVPVGGGGGGLVFITSSDLSNVATADFTAFDATKYDAYKFVLQSVTPAVDNANFYMRTSTDGGSSFDSGASDYKLGSSLYDYMIITASVGNNAGEEGISCTVDVFGPHLAKKTQFYFSGSYYDQNDAVSLISRQSARDSSADVNAVRFFFSSGNIESGTITMYGMVNA